MDLERTENFHIMFLALNVVTKHQANTVKIGFHFALFSIILEIITCEAFLFGVPCLILHLVGKLLKYVAILNIKIQRITFLLILSS